MRRPRRFASLGIRHTNPDWVIEGCYELVKAAASRPPARHLNPGLEAWLANKQLP
jgi:hypothetical protein